MRTPGPASRTAVCRASAGAVVGVVKIEYVGFVVAGKPAQRTDRSGHLRAFDGAEKPD